MKIIRCDRLDQAEGKPSVEVRDVGEGRFLLSIALTDDDSYLGGPYPSAEIAEEEGIAQAEAAGVTLLHVVHTPYE